MEPNGDALGCPRCGAPLGLPGRAPVPRRAACPGCGAEVRSCRNCASFSPGRANDCDEPVAERVADKERANFCEHFRIAAPRAAGPGGSDGTRAALDRLFRRG